ncbi:hypothetical protein G7A66_02610 [Altererythrobacter sp. SALINAS58]|uniref:hypothetical protein n=1 Tax=Alteripontixanthobacter muriae TaxID=2705546 RepID=UPI001575B7F6|nr:hypothetical protein [Alteripontixanthobacter muriae]NTZ42002.1 hypothetical protein [Alteripontixanthobacter muriae]
MKFAKLAAATAIAFGVPAAASAQDAAPAASAAAELTIAPGVTIYDPQGGLVGTVLEVSDDVVLVNTGKHTAPLPANAFAKGPNGPIISVTQAQLNQMLDEQMAQVAAQRDTALVEGAMVHTVDDAMLGTVTSIDADNIVVTGENGPVAMLRDQFAVNPEGTLIVLFTEAQIAEAAAAATPAG